MAPKAVVAAVIEKDGRYLVAQRAEAKHYPLQWEFPGGKTEPGETPQQALVREIQEELGIEVEVGPLVAKVHHDYGGGHDYDLQFFFCRITSGVPKVRDGQGIRAIRWVEAHRLADLDFLEGNRSIIGRLAFGDAEGPA